MVPAINKVWLSQIKQNRTIAVGLMVGLIALAILLLLGWGNDFAHPNNQLIWALFGGIAGCLATSLGACLALYLKHIPSKTQDILLGFAAGMMLAASSFSLIVPGLEAAQELLDSSLLGSGILVVGLLLGTALMLGLDRFLPHEHESTGPCGIGCERLSRVWLFVFAITLHNIPEGMAIGVGFSASNPMAGIPLAAAISIQDIPEGLAVAFALRSAGLSAVKSMLVASFSGMMEPIGALVGLWISSGFALAYPLSMGLAAGAMIFVVSHEVIPETHRNGHQTLATLGLMAGFAVMMFLDQAFG